MRYDRQFSAEEIQNEEYKDLLGGRSEFWEARGEAQLNFLQSAGMTRSDVFLDIGCGPIRAGEHFISFLDRGNYIGIDYNASFIEAAKRIIRMRNLEEKSPSFHVVDDFVLPPDAARANFALAFSVLIHCTEAQRKSFFINMGKRLQQGTRLFVTHARLLEGYDPSEHNLRFQRKYNQTDLSCFDDAWTIQDRQIVFPILEYVKT